MGRSTRGVNRNSCIIMNIYIDLENLESFIKCEATNNKIDIDTANEIVRLIREIKNKEHAINIFEKR